MWPYTVGNIYANISIDIGQYIPGSEMDWPNNGPGLAGRKK